MAQPVVNFYQHKIRGGNDAGARDDFEFMIIDLVSITNPGAWGVAANPGDWGIDVLVGELDGEVAVWQAKYFIDGYGESQRKQVQESLRSLMKQAKARGFAVKYWTLCIPVALPPEELLLWQKWKRKKEREHDFTIEIWDTHNLRRKLISPELCDVLHHYYGTDQPGRTPRVPLSVHDVPDDIDLEDTLFVSQLRHNGHAALGPSKKQFFNAELMTRDILDKGVHRELEALVEATDLANAIWAERFDETCNREPDNKFPSLLTNVMTALREQRATLSGHLPARATHIQGIVHQQVDQGAAGWARDWESVREAYLARTTTTGDDGVASTDTMAPAATAATHAGAS